ncbi:MAG: hydantoinase/oxoprolinase family protein [Solirubrobacterales bacterium]|nr:hydantoinase/oxoprolinase family protein [Solirubrobacterales bacterium]
MAALTTLAVDVGGTFTDAVVNSPSGVFTGKTPTTPEDQSIGVLAAAQEALAAGAVAPSEVDDFVNGMTVTTNALLEGRFAKTALLTTAGFEDIDEIGRQNRADLYRLGAARPAPIVPAELRFGVTERCGPDGVVTPIDLLTVREALDAAIAGGAESIAVCLLFAFRFPEHESAIREMAREVDPSLHVSLSHEAVGTFREYERCATTIADAALSPLLAGYLGRLTGRAVEAGLPAPQVMLSNGGTMPAETAGRNASWTVLSGPAGGAVGAAQSAERCGEPKALAFDMGGTSTDISLVRDGAVAVSAAREIGGRPIALPAVDVSTVGAGGGSIAWQDAGGALRVGPRSAGARPGPACYGHGGEEATVTDANLLLGYLSENSALAGGLRLDRAAAERALAGVGEPLGLDALATAAGVIEIANLEMLRATAAATVARGIDPRDHALVAFGGAGPMHAAAIAEALEITRVICPAACGVLSAWGISVAGRRRDRSRSIVKSLDQLDSEALMDIENELAESAALELGIAAGEYEVETAYELRYSGQAFELPVVAEHADLGTAFHAAHEERFGFSEPEASVELVTLRVSVSTPPGQVRTPGASATSPPESETRATWFGGEEFSAVVVADAPPAGRQIAGPAVIEQSQTTIVVPPGWVASSAGADIVLDRMKGGAG